MILWSLRHPLGVVLAHLALGILALASARSIPLELFPESAFPRLSVLLVWSGATPESMEARLTAPVEAVLGQVRGLRSIRSVSREGRAEIELILRRGVDVHRTRLEVVERLFGAAEGFPEGAAPPRVLPWIPPELRREMERPFFALTLSGPHSIDALERVLETGIAPELRRVAGVAEVNVLGARNRQVAVWLDPDPMVARGVTPRAVAQALAGSGLNQGVGQVEVEGRLWPVRIRTPTGPIRGLEGLGVVSERGESVPLQTLARIQDVRAPPTLLHRIHGRPAVSLELRRTPGSDAPSVSRAVRARLEALAEALPSGTRVEILVDQGGEVAEALSRLRDRLWVSLGGLVLILFVVLRSPARALVGLGAVVAAVFFPLLPAPTLGLSLNLMTLAGIGVALGLVVDQAIVVLENMDRRRGLGDRPLRASAQGAREVWPPLVGTTATTLAVALPLLTVEEEMRILILPLVWMVALALVVSTGVALSLIPALGLRTLAAPIQPYALPGVRPILTAPIRLAIRAPRRVLLVLLSMVLATGWGVEAWLPRGEGFNGDLHHLPSRVLVTILHPQGDDLHRVDQVARRFEDRLLGVDGVARLTTLVREGWGTLEVGFSREAESGLIPQIVEESLRGMAGAMGAVEVQIFGQGPAFAGRRQGSSAPGQRVIFLGHDLQTLRGVAEAFGARVALNPRVTQVDPHAPPEGSRPRSHQELLLRPNPEALLRLGVPQAALSAWVEEALPGGGAWGWVRVEEGVLPYQLGALGGGEGGMEALLATRRSGAEGGTLPLGALVSAEARPIPPEIRRVDQTYTWTVAYTFRGPVALAEGFRKAALDATPLPPGIRVQGPSTEVEPPSRALLLFAFLGLWLGVATVLESLRQALVVVLSVPLALVGVGLLFLATGTPLGREALAATILTGGVAVNHGILLVERVNRLRRVRGGESTLSELVLQGTLDRVRPVVLTTLTSMVSILPLVLMGAGGELWLWRALTYPLLGGLMAATVLGLVGTPALYLVLESGHGAGGKGIGPPAPTPQSPPHSAPARSAPDPGLRSSR